MTERKRRSRAKPGYHGAPMPLKIELRWNNFPAAHDALIDVFKTQSAIGIFVDKLIAWARWDIPAAVSQQAAPAAQSLGIDRLQRIRELSDALHDELGNLGNREWRALMNAETALYPEDLKDAKRGKRTVTIPTKDGLRDVDIGPPDFSPITFGTAAMMERLRRLRDAAHTGQQSMTGTKSKRGSGKPRTPPTLIEVAVNIAKEFVSAGTDPSEDPNGPFVAILEILGDLAGDQGLRHGLSARHLAQQALRNIRAEVPE